MDLDPDWLDELTLRAAPPFLEMGTHQLRDEGWLVVDERRDEQLALKRSVLAEHRDIVSARLPGQEPAAREVLGLVEEWLARYQSGLPGADPTDADRPLLEQAALLVQEDLTLLHRQDDGRWYLGDLVVCFPTFWLPASKLGLPITEIHDPVPHYADELATRVAKFIDKLSPARPALRRNWGVSLTPALFTPADPSVSGYPNYPVAEEAVVVGEDGAPSLYLRSERETLRRLPETDAVLFTIRVQQTPIGVLANHPEKAAAMAVAVRSWDEASAQYRSTGSVIPELLAWLDTVATPA